MQYLRSRSIRLAAVSHSSSSTLAPWFHQCWEWRENPQYCLGYLHFLLCHPWSKDHLLLLPQLQDSHSARKFSVSRHGICFCSLSASQGISWMHYITSNDKTKKGLTFFMFIITLVLILLYSPMLARKKGFIWSIIQKQSQWTWVAWFLKH